MIATLDRIQKQKLATAMSRDATFLDRSWITPWELLPWPAAEWQKRALAQILPRRENVLMNCCRGAGKSETVARAAYREACDGGYVLVVSPSDRQSIKFFNHVRRTHRDWNLVEGDADPTKHELWLSNGGHVEAVPSKEETLRSIHNVTLLILDEASRIKDELYGAVLPMLAPDGRIVALSTPNGRRGFFHKEWVGEGRTDWRRHLVQQPMCPWITTQMIAQYRASTSDLMVQQEYFCEFLSLVNSPFDVEAMMALERSDYETF